MIRNAGVASSDERGYHHGNLRAALVDAGVQLARTGGPNAVLLRAASREAGVSHNAAYRHFANQEALLAAVAKRCMQQLSLLMTQRLKLVTVRSPIPRAQARLEAIGRAYIDFARTEPGWFRTAFTATHTDDAEDVNPEAPADDNAIPDPFDILNARLDELVEVGALAPERRAGAEYAAWSSVHGASSLLLDGPLRDLPESEVERVIDAVLGVTKRGLE